MDYYKNLDLIKRWFTDNGGREDAVLLDGFVDSLIGTTHDGRAVYDLDKMIEEYGKNNDIDDAFEILDFIEYNIFNSLNSFGDASPVIIESMTWPLSMYKRQEAKEKKASSKKAISDGVIK